MYRFHNNSLKQIKKSDKVLSNIRKRYWKV